MAYKVIGEDKIDLAKQPVNRQKAQPVGHDAKIKMFSAAKDRFFQIDRKSFIPNTEINFNLYTQKGMEFDLTIKADSGLPALLTEESLKTILDDTSSGIVIENTQLELYLAYMNVAAASSSLPENEAIERKTVAIRENSKVVMKKLLEDPRSGKKIKEVQNSVNSITDMLFENRDMIYSMLTLSKYDYYTYTHCVNVGTLSVGLGIAIGMDKKELGDLGIGAMLHDIGKSEIPSEILNKQGKLSDIEFRRIQEHVREGEKILRENPSIPQEAYIPVLQHHEKLSGKGYPDRLKGQEIGLFGRISAIADCYDALTTQRPYKAAFSSFEALKIISNETSDYDPQLLTKFIKMLGKIK